MSLEFVLLDFEHARVRKRAQCKSSFLEFEKKNHTNCRRHAAIHEVNRTTTIYIIIIYIFIQVTLFLLCFQMGCRCSFSRRDGEQGAMRTSLAAKVFCFVFPVEAGWRWTELAAATKRQLQ